MRSRSVVAALAFTAVLTDAAADSLCLSGPGWTADGLPVVVPHTWNAKDGMDGPGLKPRVRTGTAADAETYERKAVKYERALPDPKPGRRYFVRFDGVSQVADVSVNGASVGRHTGAFTAFAFEVTGFLKPAGNVLEVVADNTFNENIPPISADFTIFGGVYRDVWLVDTPSVCFDRVSDGSDGVSVTTETNGDVRVAVKTLGEPARIVYTVEETGEGHATGSFNVADAKLWSPETPAVYHLAVRLECADGADEVRVPFGFRKAELRPDGFYLNGVKRKVRGVNRHQDFEGRGWAVSADDERRDFAWIKEIGADALRTAHYPQSRLVYDLCDESGVMCWTEIPCVNKLTFSGEFEANVKTMAREMVAQVGNHPSVMMWGMFNEIYNCAPDLDPEQTTAMLRRLAHYLGGLDASRAVFGASCRSDLQDLNAIPPVLAFNMYPGWYGDSVENGMARDMMRANGFNPSRTVYAITEYGAGGSVRQHEAAQIKNSAGGRFHSEEFQAWVLRENYRDILDADNVWGSFVWTMFDFASDTRTDGERNGINDKGLVTYDRSTAKDAFYLYKANWSAEPVFRLVGGRMTVTRRARHGVMAVSNLGEPVELYVNGRKVGEKLPDEVRTAVWRDVALDEGENTMEIKSAGRTEKAVWRYEPVQVRRLKVLSIGCGTDVVRYMPGCADEAGCVLDVAAFGDVDAEGRGELRWSYASVRNQNDVPFRAELDARHRGRVRDVLASERWDVVVVGPGVGEEYVETAAQTAPRSQTMREKRDVSAVGDELSIPTGWFWGLVGGDADRASGMGVGFGYLQSLVWLHTLFSVDVSKLEYTPALSADFSRKAAIMREIVR